MTINILVGETDPDPEDGHFHQYSLRVTGRGVLKAGITSSVNNHYHEITNAWCTGPQCSYPNSEEIIEHKERFHTFDFLDSKFILGLMNERSKSIKEDSLPEKVSTESL